MSKTDGFFTKMAEKNIMEQYSVYLQRASIKVDHVLYGDTSMQGVLLTYNEFKKYYINQLVGKDSYLTSLVLDLQFSNNDSDL